jgi:transposase
VHQPAQVRLYARLILRHAKTDKLDAALIAAFTVQHHPDRLPADPRLVPLAALLGYIEQVEADIVRLKTRLEQQHDPRLRAMIVADMAALRARCKAERQRLEAELRQYPDLDRRLELVLSIPGIGRPTALDLVIYMPELGRPSHQQVAALAGLAPFNHDSGQMRGTRHIAGGRTRVRTALFAAALPAAFRWNPTLVRLYRRLTANGKPHKLALIACARKLLIFANTVLARNTPWIHQS